MSRIDEILAAGGERRIALLQFCVMSVTMEPLFVFLARAYCLRPTHIGALALYDVFCAADAPARIRALHVLPPRHLRLLSDIQIIRSQWAQMRSDEVPDEGSSVPITVPHRHLFDFVTEALRNDPDGHYARLSRAFDPERTPQQNLSGGRINDGQRRFREKIWVPVARPRLVAAGFWQIGAIE